MCRSNLTEGKWILLFQKFLFLYQKIPFLYLLIKTKPQEFLFMLFTSAMVCGVCLMLKLEESFTLLFLVNASCLCVESTNMCDLGTFIFSYNYRLYFKSDFISLL